MAVTERSYYFNLQKRVIESKINTKEQNTKNIALWQTVGLLIEQEFIDLMVIVNATYPDAEAPTVIPQ